MAEPTSSTCIACKADPNASYARFVSRINGRVGYVCSPECKDQLVGVVYGVVDPSQPDRMTVYTIMPESDGHVPIFVQGDAPNQWYTATRQQASAIHAYVDWVAHQYMPDKDHVHTGKTHRVTHDHIYSLHGDNKPRLYRSHIPFGKADAHDGAGN